MSTQTEALKLALEALEICEKDGYIPVRLTRESITAIKEALAQPEQEHDLQDTRCKCCGYMTYHREHMGCIRAAKPEQESVARSDAYYMIDRFLQNNLNSDADYAEYSKALDSIYLTPPQRKPLTRGQIREIEVDVSLNPSFDYITPAEQLCRAIEAAHGIKE